MIIVNIQHLNNSSVSTFDESEPFYNLKVKRWSPSKDNQADEAWKTLKTRMKASKMLWHGKKYDTLIQEMLAHLKI